MPDRPSSIAATPSSGRTQRAWTNGSVARSQDTNGSHAQVHEILRRWDAGEIDGAACWTHCVEHMLTRPPGGVGLPGQVMVDAATTGDWGYPHGGALVVRNDWLAENRGVALRFVERIARMNYDYVTNTRAPGWDADGRYLC